MGEHAWSLGAGAGFLALTLWMSLAIPRYLHEAIDLLATDRSGSEVLFRVWLILGFAVAMVLTRTVSRMLFLVPGRRVEFDLKNRLLAHLLRQDREYFLANPTGELISRINNDINGVRMLLGMGTMMLIQTAGTLTPRALVHVPDLAATHTLVRAADRRRIRRAPGGRPADAPEPAVANEGPAGAFRLHGGIVRRPRPAQVVPRPRLGGAALRGA